MLSASDFILATLRNPNRGVPEPTASFHGPVAVAPPAPEPPPDDIGDMCHNPHFRMENILALAAYAAQQEAAS